MKYFLYDTEAECLAIDAIIYKGENIGSIDSGAFKNYAIGQMTDTGEWAYIADEVTSKYITDREAQDVTFPAQAELKQN